MGITGTSGRKLMSGGGSVDLTKGFCPRTSTATLVNYFQEYQAGTNEAYYKHYCKFYQAVSLIGYNVPDAYSTVADEMKGFFVN